ncbi:MAG: hypothetical protein HY280_07755 [Nitrospinae bacterium]|nr:hypothetical protein [Nitrospinota bacterium]
MKKKSILSAAILAGAFSAVSCAGFSAYKYRQSYAMISPVQNYDGVYEDASLRFQFEFTEKKINVLISNRGAKPVEVEWPDAQYVDPEGFKHKVANKQTAISKDQDKIKPTSIAPGADEENLIVPADNQEQMEQWTWYIKPLFNLKDDKAPANLDKTFSVIIPVAIDAEKRLYNFQFKVATVMRYTGRTPG